jgi:hypothetical protein
MRHDQRARLLLRSPNGQWVKVFRYLRRTYQDKSGCAVGGYGLPVGGVENVPLSNDHRDDSADIGRGVIRHGYNSRADVHSVQAGGLTPKDMFGKASD